ncbi:MAG: hypothetical protein FWG20_05665 [Candidatus Cloacimonetes bacterium]|nr:hypothetical protein [Candidatus Cloacimonadota bacterium]
MSFGISLSEFLLIIAVMIVFISPKDLPKIVRTAVKMVKKLNVKIREIMDRFE